MPTPPVVVARLSLFKLSPERKRLTAVKAALLLLLLGVQFSQVQAQTQFIDGSLSDAPRYIADIRLHTAAELDALLMRVDDAVQGHFQSEEQLEPVVFVLHGREALALTRSNYANNKSLVDRAARLSAFGVVDIRVCERWLGKQSLHAEQLPPFITTVSWGAEEERRLRNDEGYIGF